jgi:mono/diheme cytochrome c family protein
MRAFSSVGIFLVLVSTGCPKGGTDAPEDPAVARGRQVYMGTCIACHNVNPALPGAIGPEVKGASRALLEERILRAAYPAGYTPKRDTKLMPAQPTLASSIDDLVAFLK